MTRPTNEARSLKALKDQQCLMGLLVLNEKMIMTGSNVASRGKLKELDREDARKRPGAIVLRMTWKV